MATHGEDFCSELLFSKPAGAAGLPETSPGYCWAKAGYTLDRTGHQPATEPMQLEQLSRYTCWRTCRALQII